VWLVADQFEGPDNVWPLRLRGNVDFRHRHRFSYMQVFSDKVELKRAVRNFKTALSTVSDSFSKKLGLTFQSPRH
jgi:hypothetical protein